MLVKEILSPFKILSDVFYWKEKSRKLISFSEHFGMGVGYVKITREHLMPAQK